MAWLPFDYPDADEAYQLPILEGYDLKKPIQVLIVALPMPDREVNVQSNHRHRKQIQVQFVLEAYLLDPDGKPIDRALSLLPVEVTTTGPRSPEADQRARLKALRVAETYARSQFAVHYST